MRISKLLPFAMFLMHADISAIDRLVVPGGGGGTFPTIQSAINASSTGDRVLVTPATYAGDLVVNKAVTVLSNASGSRYNIAGSVYFEFYDALPTAITLQDAQATMPGSNVQVTVNSGGGVSRHLYVINCKFNGLSVSPARVRPILLQDTIIGSVSVREGEIIGCLITGVLLVSLPGTAYENGPVNGTNNRIIGNTIGNGSGTSINIWPAGQHAVLHMDIHNNHLLGPIVCSGYSIFSIQNNTIQSATPPLVLQDDHAYVSVPMDVRNNLLISDQPMNFDPDLSALTQGYNIQGTASEINTDTGMPLPGSAAINGGDPNAIYTDLDLSRNDAGCYGGSLCRDQFDDALPISAVVAFVDASRRLVQGNTLNVNAYGIDR